MSIFNIQFNVFVCFVFFVFFFSDEVEIKFDSDKAWLVNNEYGTEPLVAHGNGASKVFGNLHVV